MNDYNDEYLIAAVDQVQEALLKLIEVVERIDKKIDVHGGTDELIEIPEL